ncbi:hypothetical protein Tco_0920328 [Tanacetum coccineum]
MASQDVRLSKFEADFKQQQSGMTKKIDTVLKVITDRIARALPSDTCSTYIHGSINTITIHQCNPHDDMPEVDEQKREGNPENTNTVELKEEQSGTPQLELKDPTAITKIEPSRGNEEGKIEWVDVEEPLDLVDTCE